MLRNAVDMGFDGIWGSSCFSIFNKMDHRVLLDLSLFAGGYGSSILFLLARASKRLRSWDTCPGSCSGRLWLRRWESLSRKTFAGRCWRCGGLRLAEDSQSLRGLHSKKTNLPKIFKESHCGHVVDPVHQSAPNKVPAASRTIC